MDRNPATNGPGLEKLPILAVDCQSTGAPGRGHLLEVAWAALPSLEPHVESSTVALPEGEALPPRIRALTGIEPADLEGAPEPAAVWQRLRDAAASRPLVAHFARFERGFFEALHADHGDGGAFPLELICTHEIACRLLPGLPRRGLRAVAGYFGLVMGEPKRAASHVRATAIVWSHLVRRLREDADVHTLEDLRAWMDAVPPQRRGGHEFAMPRAKRLELPDGPGVYRMRARKGEVLYVGKATSLKRRVNSYFQKHRHDADRTHELLTQVYDVDVTETASALEAALLEADEIKARTPPYNRALKPRDATLDAGDDVVLAALRALLRGEDDEACWRTALGVPEQTELDPECLQEGLETFRTQHVRGGGAFPSPAVQGLGMRLWRRHLERVAERRAERQARREAGIEAEEAPKTKRKREWKLRDPAQVVRLLERTVLVIAHHRRRAYWFRRLQDCVMRWRPAARGEDAPLRELVFAAGQLAHARDVAPDAAWPPVSDHAPERVRDPATYDRLRVFTTELRRLTTEGHELSLRLSALVTLDRARLAKRLYWL